MLNFDRTVRVELGNMNLNTIKEQQGLCIDRDSAFMYIRRDMSFIDDYGGNAVDTVKYQSFLAEKVRFYGVDDVAPVLENWEFDYDAETLTLQFSETVVAATIK